MIVESIAAEFNRYFQSPEAELIIWLDPHREWGGVIGFLKERFSLVQYSGSQLEAKAAVELAWAKGEKPRFVLYLPGLDRDALSVLKEYEFSGKVFAETPLAALERWGVTIQEKDRTKIEKILPILLREYATKDINFWQSILTDDHFTGVLFSDGEVLRKMVAAPTATTQELRNSGQFDFFCDFVQDQYEGPRLKDFDPKEWGMTLHCVSHVD